MLCPMPSQVPSHDPAAEANDLLTLASWYRAWAELAGNEHEQAQRLSLAEHLEQRAREIRAR